IAEAGIAVERYRHDTKTSAWWAYSTPERRHNELRTAHQRAQAIPNWPEDVDLAPCLVVDHTHLYGLADLPLGLDRAEALQPGPSSPGGCARSSAATWCWTTPTARWWWTRDCSPGGRSPRWRRTASTAWSAPACAPPPSRRCSDRTMRVTDRTMRVLVIEDDEDLRHAVAADLAAAGLQVDQAGDLAQAHRALESAEYHCAVFDRMLPDGDAITYVHRRRQQGWAVPVLFLTARDQLADRL